MEGAVRRQIAGRLARDGFQAQRPGGGEFRRDRSAPRHADDRGTWTREFPKTGYEIRFEAMREQGNDFFASLTFPVADSFATWVTGGWGGDIVGMSSIDGWDASENQTRSYFNFENGKWYAFRLEVRPDRVRAWIDGAPVFNVGIAGRDISLRPGDIERSAPLGFASYATKGAIRKVEYRMLPPVK